jgi:hypothetical protein
VSRSGEAPCPHVLSLARQHLAALDERIGQLTRFRGQLAETLDARDGRQPTPAGALCPMIAAAEPDAALRPATRPLARARHDRHAQGGPS